MNDTNTELFAADYYAARLDRARCLTLADTFAAEDRAAAILAAADRAGVDLYLQVLNLDARARQAAAAVRAAEVG